MDIVMPGEIDGIDTAKKIRVELDIPVILLTGHAGEDFIGRAKCAEPFGYLVKPFRDKEVKAAIELALHRKDQERRARDSVSKYESLTEAVPRVFWLSTGDYSRVLYVSKAYDNIWRRSRENLNQSPLDFLEAVHPDDYQNVLKSMQKQKSGQITEALYRIVHPEGSICWIKDCAFPLMDSHGAVDRIARIAEDVTERKNAEDALRRTTRLLDSIRKAQATYILNTDSGQFFAELLKTAVELTQSEYGFLAEVLRDEKGEFYRFSLALSDISWDEDSKRLYEILTARKMEFRDMHTLAGAPVVTGEHVIANDPAHHSMFKGLPQGHPPLNAYMGIPMNFGGELVGVLGLANRPGGYSEDIASFLEPFVNTCAGIIHAVRRDKTERQHQAALASSEQLLQTMMNAVTESAFLMSIDGTVELMNRTCAERLGRTPEEIVGKSIYDFVPVEVTADRRKKERAVIRTGQPIQFEDTWSGRHFLNSIYPVKDEQGRTVRLAIFGQDITERKLSEKEKAKLEAQLRQSQKLEAIGTLAGGIAHDFNNILAAILGYTEMALDDVPEDSSPRHDLEQVLAATYRAKDLVKQILAFSRQGETRERRPIAIVPIVKEALKLLRSTLPTTIELRQDISDESGSVMGDPTQLHQVLLNLCTNAAHAMRGSCGVLEVTLGGVEFDANSAGSFEDLKPGSYVKLAVSDTGHGMDSATLERIFDPYFTTKRTSEGSGLGLAVVHGIVKRHEGCVFVRSEPGKGTVFELFFPGIDAGMESMEHGPEPVPRGTERILFVDDEEALAAMAERMLWKLGYEVTVSTSGIEALELLRGQPDAFDLVITDYTMPHMTGVELAGEMLRIRPDIPIVLCTGFSETISGEKVLEMGIRAFVLKPLSRRNIAEVIRRVLDIT
jgi:PAS domain S-box-containing protein